MELKTAEEYDELAAKCRNVIAVTSSQETIKSLTVDAEHYEAMAIRLRLNSKPPV